MSESSTTRAVPEWQVWAALGIVYIVWGSTYLAIRVVVETMPPLLSGGFRHLAAALIIFAFLVLRRGPRALRLSRGEWLGATFVGLALLLGGNGLVMLGERDVPSGLAALIVAVVPLWVVMLRFAFGERIGRGTIAGVIVGFAGVAVLIVPEGVSGEVSFVGMLMMVGAGLSWSIGSYFAKRVELPHDPFASTAAQMLVGGLSLAAVGLLVGEPAAFEVADFSTRSLVSWLYLVTFGSILAYTAYTFALQHAPVSRVATYAYVNPVVAIVLGAVLLNEEIHATMLLGAAMIIVSVALVLRTESIRTPKPDAAPDPADVLDIPTSDAEEADSRGVTRPA